MRILGFDTATRATAVALCDLDGSGERLEARDDPPLGARPAHATRLMSLIVELLERSGGGWEELDRVAVGVGPGTFTGLRIGIATANAIGHARGIPLVGVSTLESLAHGGARAAKRGTFGPIPDVVLAVIDARRGEVFAGAWRTRGGSLSDQLLVPAALPPEELESRLAALGSSVLAVGDGAVEFRSTVERSGALVPDDDSDLHRVSAINHCLLAERLPASGSEDIRPQYLRLPDAEIARRAAGDK